MIFFQYIFLLCFVFQLLHCIGSENFQNVTNSYNTTISNDGLKKPCEFEASVSLNIKQIFPNNSVLSENGTLYSSDEYMEHSVENKTEIRGCICLKQSCLKRCCPYGQAMNTSAICIPYNETEFSPPFMSEGESKFYFVNEKLKCPNGIASFEADGIEKDGSIYDTSTHIESSDYCTTQLIDNDTIIYEFYYCNTYENYYVFPYKDHIYAAGFFLSFSFLLVTYLVYIFLPELRKKHGKYIMNFVLSLALTSLSMFIIKTVTINYFHDEINTTVCHSMALITYYFTMASFFWMNIMCIDIYLTFSKTMDSLHLSTRLFFYRFSYAWGFPLILLILTIILQYHPNIPPYIIIPRIGLNMCWFEYQSNSYYVYIPMTILLAVNIVLFSLTTFNIIKLKRETSVLRKGSNSVNRKNSINKERYTLYFRLFLVMGINWIAEVISHFCEGSDSYWIVPDTLNTLIGVFIFFIFIWKKHVRISIQRRFRGSEYNTRNNFDGSSSARSHSTLASSRKESVVLNPMH